MGVEKVHPEWTPRPSQDYHSDKASSDWSTSFTDRLVDLLHRGYRRWAYFIVDHAIAVIIACVLLTVVCTAKMVTTP
jgi:hypothetical protein